MTSFFDLPAAADFANSESEVDLKTFSSKKRAEIKELLKKFCDAFKNKFQATRAANVPEGLYGSGLFEECKVLDPFKKSPN